MFQREQPFVPPKEYWQEIAALDKSLHQQDPNPHRYGPFYRSEHTEGVWLPLGEAMHINPLERMTPHVSWESERDIFGRISGTLIVGRLIGHNGEIKSDTEPSFFDFALKPHSNGALLVKASSPDIEPSVFETTYNYRISPFALSRSTVKVSYDARIFDEISGKLESIAEDCDLDWVEQYEHNTGFREPSKEQYSELLKELSNGAWGAMQLTDQIWAPTEGNVDPEDEWNDAGTDPEGGPTEQEDD